MTFVAQEGGDHYQSEYQHWDWVVDLEMGYLPGCATKYITRWRNKNGIADLEKAISYTRKIMAVSETGRLVTRQPSYKTRVHTEHFIETNNIPQDEQDILWLYTGPCSYTMMELAIERIQALVRDARQRATMQAAVSTASREPSGMAHPFGYEAENE